MLNFTGYHFEDITHFPTKIDLVMLHVLTRGGPEELRWLIRRRCDARVRRWTAAAAARLRR
jgi:hypothetical protein